MSADTVDDLVADVFVTVWKRIEDVPPEAEVRPWLYRIAYLTTSNHWRRSSRKKKLDEKLEALGVPGQTTLIDQVVARDEVRSALAVLDGLGAKDREVIKLSVWEHLSSDDIAAVLDLTPLAARQRLHRARKRLTTEYEKRHKDAVKPPLLRKEVSGEH